MDLPVPLYFQIKEKIINDILERKLQRDDRFFSEPELCKIYNVSRITVRRAIAELVNEEVLYKIPAKGTFVAEKAHAKRNSHIPEKQIAVIVPDIDEYAVATIYAGAKQKADEKSYSTALYTTGRDIEKECREISRLKQMNYSGTIIFPNWGKANAEQIFELKRDDFKFVLVDRFFRDIDTDYVVTDNKYGAFLAVSHLIELGHKRIAHIGWPAHTAGMDRLEGYKEALIKNKLLIEEELIISLDSAKFAELKIEPGAGGYEETRRLISSKQCPTAIFAASDPIAIGVLQAIKDAGFRVPDDISVVGFDDLKISSLLEVPLTTIAQPFREIGEKAMEILIDKIENNTRTLQQLVIKPRLVVRKTSATHK